MLSVHDDSSNSFIQGLSEGEAVSLNSFSLDKGPSPFQHTRQSLLNGPMFYFQSCRHSSWILSMTDPQPI